VRWLVLTLPSLLCALHHHHPQTNSTFARGWPVPDAVKFHANQLLWGQWDPYPIDMGFQPPCMVRAGWAVGLGCGG
jgi:chlorophyllide a oxygenase